MTLFFLARLHLCEANQFGLYLVIADLNVFSCYQL